MRLLMLIAMAFAASVAYGGLANASEICGITRVERTSEGVRVYFEPTWVEVLRPGEKPLMIMVDPNAPEEAKPHNTADRVRAVPAVLGDGLRWRQRAHSVCNMTVAAQGDSIGILATFGSALPGLPPTTTQSSFRLGSR
jgi:hypothetical protein